MIERNKKCYTLINIEQDDFNFGYYWMEHDLYYVTGRCFKFKIYWLFARGPSLKSNVV